MSQVTEVSKVRTRITCPYCSNEFIAYLDKESYRPQIVPCDTEDSPGCGEWFAVGVVMVPQVEYYKVEMIIRNEGE